MRTDQRSGPGLLPKLTLAVSAAVLTLAAAEGAARLYLGDDFIGALPIGRPDKQCAIHDRELGWRNAPGAVAQVVAPLFSYRLAINSKGLRDTEHGYPKPDGKIRVALLGDSIAWGWGVDNGRSFADIVERDLGDDVEVINLGVPGYGTDQELWTLESEGLRYQPDITLLCFVLNDVVSNDQIQSQGRFKPCFRFRNDEWRLVGRPVPEPEAAPPEEERTALLERFYWHSALLQLVSPPDAEQQLAREGGGGARGSGEAQAALRDMCTEVSRPGSTTHMLLGRLSDLCREHGLPLVAFTVPHHHDQYLYWPNLERPPKTEQEGFQTFLTAQLARAGRELGFQTFSVDDAMLAEVKKGQVLTCGDGHLNERGNQVVAARVVEALRPAVDEVRRTRGG